MPPSTILLVEDDAGHARLIQRYLNHAGLMARLVHVSDGQAALDFLQRRYRLADQPVSERVLVLLDIELPSLDGMQVLDAIRAAPELRAIPVIMLTTTDDDRTIARCYDHGCSGYVVKPIGYAAFRRAIERLDEWLMTVAVPETGGSHAGAVHRG